MPTYEYACGKCEHEFEVEQRITDDPVRSCPRCRSRKVRRLISRTSFVLKGGGWYSDLYSSSGGKGGKKKSDGAGGSGSSEKSDSGDSKPAAKPETPKSDSGGAGGGETKAKGTRAA